MKPLRRLLIANRGEIARRVIRTARRMGIETVAVFSGPDANAMHVREATAAVALDGAASTDSYLRADKLLAAARAAGADAVHPGYGFLSEDADFAQAVVDAGLTWIGPPPDAIRRLGSKSSAKLLAQARGVPCLPGHAGEDQGDERFLVEAGRIGYPVMVKAAAGGGGRGMRPVHSEDDLVAALHGARSEALSSFGSDELLLERALASPRHVEVQVFADAHGHCIHLGERDCSLQRRHQKLVEETPAPGLDAGLRERMARCAVDLALAAGYVGAGTVEFLVEGGEFFLMEMNTRLQVEHPVTEAVTGLDLVEWQLRVARGEELPLTQDQVRFEGHAIEARLCAEDEHFAPHTGTVLRFEPPQVEGIRFDHAIETGAVVSAHYDSMLGKLVAHAATREEAIDLLASALDQLVLLGLPTNRRLLVESLRSDEFRAGAATVAFFARHAAALRERLASEEKAVAGSAATAVLSPPGSVLPCPYPRPLRFRHRDEVHDGGVAGPVRADGVEVERHRWHVQAGSIDLFVDDLSWAPAAGSAAAETNQVRAPFNGKVIAVNAAPGQLVRKGDPIAVLESMKLEHALPAPRDGRVASVNVGVGQQAATSQLLVTLEPVP